MDYYSIPLKMDRLREGKQLERIEDIRLSIHENIRFILKSFSLSYRFDPSFGCILNKFHASTPPQRRSERAWREEIREKTQKNLKDMMQRYETRIKVTDVIVDMMEPKIYEKEAVVKVEVEIDGYLTLGRKEKFHFPDSEVDEAAKEVFPLMIPVGRK